jgi:hypothetical protein
MRMIALTILMFSNVCFAKSNLLVGASSGDSFLVDVVASNPMQVAVQNQQTQKSEIISFENSVSDLKKLTIKKSNSTNSMELLLVVLAVADKEQAVLVFDLQKSNSSLCKLRNEGDFSWTDDQDLMSRVRIASKNQKEVLQFKIGNRKSGSTKFSWMNCAAI